MKPTNSLIKNIHLQDRQPTEIFAQAPSATTEKAPVDNQSEVGELGSAAAGAALIGGTGMVGGMYAGTTLGVIHGVNIASSGIAGVVLGPLYGVMYGAWGALLGGAVFGVAGVVLGGVVGRKLYDSVGKQDSEKEAA